MFRPLRNVLRLLGIARTLARYDALFPAEWLPATGGLVFMARLLSGFRTAPDIRDLRDGERLARALQALGPSFIKFGQMLSTRADLVGETIAADLSTLQDQLPAFSSAEARAAIEAEFETSVDNLFEDFDDTPVAAASIAQVHIAKVRVHNETSDIPQENAPEDELRTVAVKVLRPGIERAIERDLELFRWIAETAERAQPRLRRLKPIAAVETFATSLRWEMDLRMEGAAASELRGNFEDDPLYVVPSVDWERTGQRILTTEWIDGIPIHDVDDLVAAGHDLEAVVRKASESFFLQVFRDGFFHADMHPGNAFVRADGALCVVDFGIMGRIDRPTRYFLADMLLGFITRDYPRVSDVHFQAGYIPPETDREVFQQAIRAIGEPIFDRPPNEISIARLLAQLFLVSERFDMEAQPQLLMLQKTMLIAEGVGRRLAPELNMWQLALPLIEDWMREHRGPEARLAEVAASTILAVQRLPDAVQAVERAATTISEGRLSLDLKTAGSPKWPLWLAIAVTAAISVVALLN
ncbi:MAG: 2-polyprenylphenol 6-hydroxylase [Alphaproteobacteria bacterium]|nr:2-polyprenylphenol 6-hydroxylase [Alphaproteobacteria bacterium]